MNGEKRKVSSLWFFLAAVILLVVSWVAARSSAVEIWLVAIPVALVLFLWGAIRNHREHLRR